MNWLKTLWDKVVSKTSTSPKLSIVEEEPASEEVEKCSEAAIVALWTEILVGVGVKPKHYSIQRHKFVESYESGCSLNAVHAAMVSFFKDHEPTNSINEKLVSYNVN